jgi:hypothetical protein
LRICMKRSSFLFRFLKIMIPEKADEIFADGARQKCVIRYGDEVRVQDLCVKCRRNLAQRDDHGWHSRGIMAWVNYIYRVSGNLLISRDLIGLSKKEIGHCLAL